MIFTYICQDGKEKGWVDIFQQKCCWLVSKVVLVGNVRVNPTEIHPGSRCQHLENGGSFVDDDKPLLK